MGRAAEARAEMKADLKDTFSWMTGRRSRSSHQNGAIDQANAVKRLSFSPVSGQSSNYPSQQVSSPKREQNRQLLLTDSQHNPDHDADEGRGAQEDIKTNGTTPTPEEGLDDASENAIRNLYGDIGQRVQTYLPKHWSDEGQQLTLFVTRNCYTILRRRFQELRDKYDQKIKDLREDLVIAEAAKHDSQNKLEAQEDKYNASQKLYEQQKREKEIEYGRRLETKRAEIERRKELEFDGRLQIHKKQIDSWWYEKGEQDLTSNNNEWESKWNSREARYQKEHSEHLTIIKNSYDSQLGQLKVELQQEKQDRHKDVRTWNEKHRQAIEARDIQISQQKQRYEEEQTRLIEQHEREQDDAHRLAMEADKESRRHFAKLQQEEKRKFELEKELQEREHEHKVHELLEDVTAQQNKVREIKSSAEITEMQLREKHVAEIAELTRSSKNRQEVLAAKYKSREAELLNEMHTQAATIRAQMHELNEALIARDFEKYMSAIFGTSNLIKTPDEHIKTQFSTVIDLVETLSRLEWKDDRKMFNNATLAKLGDHNQRKLQKFIVQSCIWSILFEYVCCSPFRLFGDQGIELEQEWFEKCHTNSNGEDDVYQNNGLYDWPKPSIKTERWRYFTMYGCKETLKTQPSAYDGRGQLKSDFNTNLVKITKSIAIFLKEVIDTSADTTQAIKNLLKAVSNMWLEFGQNRCRLVIFLKGIDEGIAAPRTIKDHVREAETGSLTLNTVPGIRRYGNEKGDDLGSKAILNGCSGDTRIASPKSSIADA